MSKLICIIYISYIGRRGKYTAVLEESYNSNILYQVEPGRQKWGHRFLLASILILIKVFRSRRLLFTICSQPCGIVTNFMISSSTISVGKPDLATYLWELSSGLIKSEFTSRGYANYTDSQFQPTFLTPSLTTLLILFLKRKTPKDMEWRVVPELIWLSMREIYGSWSQSVYLSRPIWLLIYLWGWIALSPSVTGRFQSLKNRICKCRVSLHYRLHLQLLQRIGMIGKKGSRDERGFSWVWLSRWVGRIGRFILSHDKHL